jgi:hypothetical protein
MKKLRGEGILTNSYVFLRRETESPSETLSSRVLYVFFESTLSLSDSLSFSRLELLQNNL